MTDAGSTQFVGYGVYVGKVIPTETGDPYLDLIAHAGLEDHKIELDSGRIVFGSECVWAPENVVREMLARRGRPVSTID